MRQALVTGGSGLIGRQLVRLLSQNDFQVTTVSLEPIQVEGSSKHVVGDLRDMEVCLDVTRSADVVYHLAGIKGSLEVTLSRPASFLVPMLQFNTSLLEASRLNGVKSLVFTSSIGAYSSAEIFHEDSGFDGQPMDLYPGWAKRIAEIQIQAYAKEYGLNWGVVRPCNVYGPGDNFDPENAMVIPSLMMKIYRGDSPVSVWGDGSAVRDFAFSEDVAEGILLAGKFGTRGSFVNIGSGVGYSIRQLVEALQTFLDFQVHFDSSKDSGYSRRVMSISRAQEWLGYSPKTSLEEGLKRTWDWFLENPYEYLKKQNYFSKPKNLGNTGDV